MLAVILEALGSVAFDLLFWAFRLRWALLTFFLIATVICLLSEFYVLSALAFGLACVCLFWRRNKYS